MKRVYATTVIGQAEMLQVVLRSHGIESRLENEGAAHYAVGLPSAAAPIGIVVDDDRADEAARIIAEEFSRPKTPDPTAVMVQIPCPCGKTLEFPRGEEPPSECPWCNRPTQAAPEPDEGATRGPGTTLVWALVVVAVLLLAVTVFGGYYGFRKAMRTAEEAAQAAINPQAGQLRRLKERIEKIPTPTLPAIDPDEIVADLTKELPEDAARYAAAFAPAATVREVVDRWMAEAAELSPDWALDRGLADSPKITRVNARTRKACALVDAQALRKLRSLRPEGSLDARLFERFLERGLLQVLLFGTDLRDPRTALWSIQASTYVKDRPALLAARLEQLPDVVAEVTRDLRDVGGPLLSLALRDINEALETLRDFEHSVPDPRTLAAIAKAREALAAYRDHLRGLKPSAKPAVDPRWILFLVREGEFSTRTPRDVARILADEAERSLMRWNAMGASVSRTTTPFTKEEWRREVQHYVVKARELTIERGFAEVPAGELPQLIDSPLLSRGMPDAPAYGSRPLAASLNGMLWITYWDATQSPTAPCAPTSAQICTMAETFPGRHLHDLLSRGSGTAARRLYPSHMLSEGWRAYCHRWAVQNVPNSAYDAIYSDGTRFSQAWSAAVEICFLSGAVSEDEAVDLLSSGTGEGTEDARARLAWGFLEPLWSAGAVLGERDLVELRNEMQTKLGARFDLKRFHTSVLATGRAPIALVREELLRDGK